MIATNPPFDSADYKDDRMAGTKHIEQAPETGLDSPETAHHSRPITEASSLSANRLAEMGCLYSSQRYMDTQ